MFENKKILIVDDEEQARLYLANIVRELYPELAIHLAATPLDAFFILKKECVHVVLLDIELPGMTGLEMLSELRSTHPELPVIFVTGYKRVEFLQQAIRLNAVDYIDKPVDPNALDSALRKSLQMKPSPSTDLHPGRRFCLFTTSGEMFVDTEQIVCFRSDKRYSTVFMADGTVKTVRDNLEGLTKKLPSNHFIRVSRQFIINVNAIKYISKSNKRITLNTVPPIEIGKIYPSAISELINNFRL